MCAGTRLHTHLNYRLIHRLTAETAQRLTLKEIKSPCGMDQPVAPPRQNAPISTRPCNLLIWVFRALWRGTSSKRKLSEAAVHRRGLPMIILGKRRPPLLAHAHKLLLHILSPSFTVTCLQESFHSKARTHINSRIIGLAQ